VSQALRRLGCPTFVPVMKTTDFGNRDDVAGLCGLDRSVVRRVFAQSEMGPTSVVIHAVRRKQPAQVCLTEDADVIKALSPNRADHPFCVGILPWTRWAGEQFCDSHSRHTSTKRVAVDAVPISEQPTWCRVVRERLDDLLSSPVRRRMLGDIDMDDAPALVGQED
jgi:hypothetical protein